jgi:hypothetical protein
LKTNQGKPAHSKSIINFVSSQNSLTEKVRNYFAKSAAFEVECSEQPQAEETVHCYIVPFPVLTALINNNQRPDTWLPVIAYGSPFFLREAFSMGACDYLKDPWDLSELEIRLKKALTDPACAAIGESDGITLTGNRLTMKTGEIALSVNESRILKVLLRKRGEVVPREVLYYAIWGKMKNTASRVVDVHISLLRRKLEGTAPWRIRQVRGEGYILS